MGSKRKKISLSRGLLRDKLKIFRISQIIPGRRRSVENPKRHEFKRSQKFQHDGQRASAGLAWRVSWERSAVRVLIFREDRSPHPLPDSDLLLSVRPLPCPQLQGALGIPGCDPSPASAPRASSDPVGRGRGTPPAMGGDSLQLEEGSARASLSEPV